MDVFMEATCLNLIFSMKIIKNFRGSPISFQNGARLLGDKDRNNKNRFLHKNIENRHLIIYS